MDCAFQKRLLRYLALGVAEDELDWAAHDKHYHHGHFDQNTMTCKARREADKGDKADASISPDGQTAFAQSPAAEYAAVVAKYKGTPEWMKAPNGKPTNLTEKQWVQVRTPSFKAWFGDWEKVSKGSAVVGQKPIAVKPLPKGVSVEDAYARLPETENAIDGRRVKFVNSTLGKILRHKGYPTERIIGQLDEIFKASIPTGFEEETVKEGHKKHPNFEGYHTYVGKIRDGEREYYVRFTVQEEKTRSKDYNPNAVHSTFVSDVALYKETGGALSQSTTSVGESEQPPITDNRLSQFFAEVNGARKNCSKIVDSNGEPKVVYHGSTEDFSTFDASKSGRSNDTEAKIGFWFAESESFADAFAKQTGDAKVYSEFLNIRNPIIFRSKDTSAAQDKLQEEISKVRSEAKRIEESYRYGDTLEQSVFQLACNDDEFNRKLLAGIRQGHPEYDGIVADAEKWRDLTAEDRRLSAKMDELRYSDSYELMRTEIAKMVGASARDANFGGLGMAYDNKGKSAGLYRAKLMAEGYDGVVIENTRFDRGLAGGDNTQIVAFKPTQIKSATSNSGAFSPAKESTLDSAPAFNPAAFLTYLAGKRKE